MQEPLPLKQWDWGYEPGISLYLRGAVIGGVSYGVITEVDEPSHQVDLPNSYVLFQNYPNPFNPTTTIKYELPTGSHVRLAVYDILGREVSELVNEKRDAGVHEIKFDAAGLASGVYFYRMMAGAFTEVRKLLLVR